MTLRHFNIFLCVCDEGNMSAAAAKLHIAQPSVSQSIAELEGHYNVKLFERLGRKLFITTAGQELLTYARHIVNLSKEAESTMREIYNHGVVRVGASVTIGTCIFSDIVGAFRKDNPNVKFNAYVNNTRIIEEMLLSDLLDIGLVEGKIHSPGIICRPFMDDELVLVSSTSHPFAQKNKITSGELNTMEFIVREEGSGTRELFESVMTSIGVNWQMLGVYNNSEAIKNNVAAGLGVSVMSRIAVQRECEVNELAIIDIENVNFKRQFHIVYHKNKYISPILASFIKVCLAYHAFISQDQ